MACYLVEPMPPGRSEACAERCPLGALTGWIRPFKKIPDCEAHAIGQPAPAVMLLAVMEQMTALAERFEVRAAIVHRVTIQMRGRQHRLGPLDRPRKVTIVDPSDRPPLPVRSKLMLGIVAAAIAQMADDLVMGAGIMLAAAPGALEV